MLNSVSTGCKTGLRLSRFLRGLLAGRKIFTLIVPIIAIAFSSHAQNSWNQKADFGGIERAAPAVITITDVLGKQLLRQESKITQGKLNEEILLNEKFTSGLYLIRSKVGNAFFVQPLIVQR